MAFVTTVSPDLYSTTSNLEEIPAGGDPLQYCDDDKMNQILVGLTALHGWASGVPVGETANGHYLGLASGSSAAVSIAGGVRIRNNAGALDYSYNTGAYARLLSKLTLASQATGDIMYASAADTWTRLAAGTNGHVLTLSGGVPTWAAGGGGGGLSSPVGAADGGTGITSYAIGDLIYASGATTLSKLADVATGNALISGGVTTAPAWGKIGLTTHVDGTLPAANGGTGQGGGYAVGDLLYASGASALSKLAAVGIGQALVSAGVGVAPVYTATPTLTSLGLATGSAAACSLYPTGDGNTGVYFPGADQVAMVAGGVVVVSGTTTTARVTAGAGYIDLAAGLQQNIAVNAATATAPYTMEIYSRTTGTAAAGFGQTWRQWIENAAGTDRLGGYLSWSWADATDTSEDCVLDIVLMNAGSAAPVAQMLGTGHVRAQTAFGFIDDTNTYLSSSGADELSFTFGGTARIRSDGSRTVWTYGGATPEAAGYISEWYTDAAEGRIKVRSSNTSGYGGFIAKGSDANKVLSMAMYGASTAGTTLGVSNNSLAEIFAYASNMVIYTSGAQAIVMGTNATKVFELGSTTSTIGFYGVTPVARAAAYTQTYSTAARTVTSGMSVDQLAQIVNSLIDDLQAYGLAQ